MRILYSHRIQSRDGQSVHLEELVGALRRAGHEVRVVGPAIFETGDFGGESRWVAWIRKRLPGCVGEIAEIAYNAVAYHRLSQAFAAFQPDIVYERYNLFFVAGALIARRRGVPFYVEVNAPLADERRKATTGLALLRAARAMERFVWRRADRIVAVTGVLRDIIAAQGAPADRIAVVPNGIDLPRFAAIPARPEHPAAIVLGFTGFMRPWHGLDALLDAVARYRDDRVQLLIVGDGDALPALRRQAAALGLGARVRFTGLAPREAIPGLLAEMDIAMQPKAVAYASPLKIFEYMAAGRAIVAPDQPNIREILRHQETALLFEPGRTAAMWEQIVQLLSDPALRHRIGMAARAEIVRRNYTWDANAQQVIAWAHQDLANRTQNAAVSTKEAPIREMEASAPPRPSRSN